MLPMIRFKLKIKKHVVVHNKFRCVWKTVQHTNRFIICNKCSLLDFLGRNALSTASIRRKQITNRIEITNKMGPCSRIYYFNVS